MKPCAAAGARWRYFALVSLDHSDSPIVVKLGKVSPATAPEVSEASPAPRATRNAALTSPPTPPSKRRPGIGMRTFWVHGKKLVARRLVSTRHADVWIEDVPALHSIDARRIARGVDIAAKAVIPRFGTIDYTAASIVNNTATYCSKSGRAIGRGPRVVDSRGGRFTVLIVSHEAAPYNYANISSYVPQAEANCYPPTHSNETPALLVTTFDASEARISYRFFPLNVAHELQHLANFVRHAILHEFGSANTFEQFRQEDPFINEGLSELAMDYAARIARPASEYASENLASVRDFMRSPSSVSLFGLSPLTLTHLHAPYGAAYLFQRYLLDRFGDRYLTAMAHSSGFGFSEIAAATGVPFPDLASGFAKAIAARRCDANSVFCKIHRLTFPAGGLDYRRVPADGSVTILEGSLSYWKVRANAYPHASAPLGVHVVLVPLNGS